MDGLCEASGASGPRRIRLASQVLGIVPPLLAAAYLYRRSPQITARGMRPTVALAVVAGIALVYTTPWDNYLPTLSAGFDD